MIDSYLVNLQLRIKAIKNYIGCIEQYNEKYIEQISAKVNEIVPNKHEDIQKKFQRIKKSIDKYDDLINERISQDRTKLNQGQLQQMSSMLQLLNQIDALVPYLNTEEYVKIKSKYNNIRYLMTVSQVQSVETPEQISITKYDQTHLQIQRQQHRQNMNQLFELNYRIVNNINCKLAQLEQKIMNE